MFKEKFVMRKIGKHLVNVSMLTLTIAPVVGTIAQPVAVYAAEQDGVTRKIEKIPFKITTTKDKTLKKGEKKIITKGVEGEKEIVTTKDLAGSYTGKVEFESKATVNTSKIVERKPVDLLAIVDSSPSITTNFTRSLDALTELIKTMKDNDQITFAHYGYNNTNSYNAGPRPEAPGAYVQNKIYLGIMSQPMNKQQALDYIQKAKKYPVTKAGINLQDFLAEMEGQGVKYHKDDNKNYQDIYMENHKATHTISVLQFTDSWMPEEEIDTDFAAWAKANAKTFMTVAFKDDQGGNGPGTDYSVQKMKKAGHPNIYSEFETPIDVQKIIKQFEATAVEKVESTKEDVSASITITAPQGAKFDQAELTTPSGVVKLTVKDNVATYMGAKIPDGKYVLNYKVSGASGKVNVKVVKNGKEILSRDGDIASTKGSVKENVIKEPIDEVIAVGTKESKVETTEKKVPFVTIYKPDPTLKKGEEKVITEGVEGLIKVTTTYDESEGVRVPKSEKSTEEVITKKVDRVVAQGSMEKRKVLYRVVDSKGQELVKETPVTEAYQDEEYKVETPKLDGYRLELQKDGVPASGKVADRDVLVTFVAAKIGKPVTLKFVDESGKELAEQKVLTKENPEVDTDFNGEAPEFIEKDKVKYAFVGIKDTGSTERKVSGKVTDKEQVIEAVYAKPKETPKKEEPKKETPKKELPKTSEQGKARNGVITALVGLAGFGSILGYFGLRKGHEE